MQLPAWADGPADFISKHRAALEVSFARYGCRGEAGSLDFVGGIVRSVPLPKDGFPHTFCFSLGILRSRDCCSQSGFGSEGWAARVGLVRGDQRVS